MKGYKITKTGADVFTATGRTAPAVVRKLLSAARAAGYTDPTGLVIEAVFDAAAFDEEPATGFNGIATVIL